MKSILIATVALGGTALASHGHLRTHARVHRALHAHDVAKRDIVEEHVQVFVMECWLGNRVISANDCDEGVRNGTLTFVDNGAAASPSTAAPSSTPAKPTTLATVVATPAPAPVQAPAPPAPAVPAPPPPPPPPAAAAPPPPPPAPKPESKVRPAVSMGSGALANVNTPFPDGQLDCNQFPEQYGALRTDWLGLGGWSAVQKPEERTPAGFNRIFSQVKTTCSGGDCCVEGSFCSYACPEGYLKYQWPSTQGATGQSIGGLYCENGKLHLTNPSVPTLCAPGAKNINVQIQNRLDSSVAVCRTNYPGDESMTAPLTAEPGTTKPLACPDAAQFYKWEGKATSAQYYMNMPGYSVEKACQWGEPGSDYGNWAPGNLGVGWSNGRAWVSITANHPTQMRVNMPYTVEILGGDSKCRYQNGQYCSGANYEQCSDSGCTVSSSGGDLTYVIS